MVDPFGVRAPVFVVAITSQTSSLDGPMSVVP
jgi:hypothetical protein